MELPLSRVHPDSVTLLAAPEAGHASIMAVAKVGGIAASVEFRCLAGEDPPAWARVEVGRALQRTSVCEGAEFDIPEVPFPTLLPPILLVTGHNPKTMRASHLALCDATSSSTMRTTIHQHPSDTRGEASATKCRCKRA